MALPPSPHTHTAAVCAQSSIPPAQVRITSLICRFGGVELLPDGQLCCCRPPLPLDPVSDIYVSKISKFMSAQGSGPGPEKIERFCEAQNVWDATMAFNIAQAVASNAANAGGTGSKVFHVCGRFHVRRLPPDSTLDPFCSPWPQLQCLKSPAVGPCRGSGEGWGGGSRADRR